MIAELPQGFWYDTLDSTMEEAKRLIQAGKIQRTAFLVASYQTDGRGTHGRQWRSPKGGGIYLSIVHLPEEGAFFETQAPYTLAAGVACVEALQETVGIETALKPVNDIYYDGKKLGGILVESELHQNGIAALITGIGLNTHIKERDVPESAALPVSLEEILSPEVFQSFSSDVLTETLVAKICFWYALLFAGQQGQVNRAWERYKIIL
jgi:biotin-[acetyl-CoA-carboxylase] ligase BirA-like protein